MKGTSSRVSSSHPTMPRASQTMLSKPLLPSVINMRITRVGFASYRVMKKALRKVVIFVVIYIRKEKKEV